MGFGISWGSQNITIKFLRNYVKERMKEKRIIRIIGPLLILISMLIVSVSALIIQQPSITVTIKLNQGILGNILEGQTLHYTPSNTSSLNDIIRITTTQANIYLNFDTDLDSQSGNYTTYQIVVKAGTVQGSTISTGATVATLTLASPDTSSGVDLDTAGAWTFDFEITTTADSLSSDQDTTVNITVSAESTST